MITLDTAAPAFQQALLDRIEARAYPGLPGPLPSALRDAFLACPRHRFVDRYRLAGRDPLRDIRDGDAAAHLAAIYQDEILGHVDADGAALASTNSVPSFILRLAALLDVRPGQRVLEIGSGSGWLLAILAHLVGPEGRATGVEIINDLAMRSRAFLAAAGIANADVIAGDGAGGWPPGAPYDRVIFTTGIWDLPAVFFGQVAPGGLLLAPFQVRGFGEDVLLLRRDAAGFTSERALPAFFVRATGAVGSGAAAPEDLDRQPLLAELAAAGPVHRLALPPAAGDFGMQTFGFRAFLSRTEPRFRAFGLPRRPGDEVVVTGFGILDAALRSAAVWCPDCLSSYGGPAAMRDLMAAWQDWTDLLMPAVAAFRATVRPAGAAPEGSWTEARGACILGWRLAPDAPRASALLAAGGMLPA